MSSSYELKALFFRYLQLTNPWVDEYKRNAENLPNTIWGKHMKNTVKWYVSLVEGNGRTEHFNSVMKEESRFKRRYCNVENVDKFLHQIIQFERYQEFIYEFEIHKTMRIRESELDEESRVELIRINQRFVDISESYYLLMASERKTKEADSDRRMAAIIALSE